MIWGALSENIPTDMCAQQTFRSACLFMQFDQNLNPSLAKYIMPYLGKQRRSKSVGFIKYVNFYQKPGSSNLIGWKLEVGMAS